jgi:hypothetical protein
MAKTDAKNEPAASTPAEEQPSPRLGEVIQVQVADGLTLINNENGNDFVPGEATPQTVTVTTLRRLADGDLIRL